MKAIRPHVLCSCILIGLSSVLCGRVGANITIEQLDASPNPAKVNANITFRCQASAKNGYTITGYNWDKATGEGSTATTSFSTPGIHTVKVTVAGQRNSDDDKGSSGGGSIDPNDKLIDVGVGSERFVREDQRLGYTIRFENMSNATASAQLITVTDPLNENLDWHTFELGAMQFGDRTIEVPEGLTYFYRRIDLRPEGNDLFVDIEATFDVTRGVATWTFTAIDPETGEFTEDPFDGFLPPNDAQHAGEGFVKFRVSPRFNLSSGTVIPNVATIVFDWNEPIDTPLVFVTIDAEPPESRVDPLPGQSDLHFLVSWSGTDDPLGSGITGYDIYVSKDMAAYELWLEETSERSAPFHGEAGAVYAFFSQAHDRVGHIETARPTPDAFTQVVEANAFDDTDGDGMSDTWEQTHGLNPNDESDGMSDVDQDGFGAVYESIHGTDPNDPNSIPLPTLYVDRTALSGGDGSMNAPFDTIQAALDVATHYTIIHVVEGLYSGEGNRDLDSRGVSLMLMADTNGNGCVIDCMEAGRGFHFHHGEDARTVVVGFSIQNSRANYGAGIYCYNASPTIRNCVLLQNEAIYHGGGIGCYNANPSIENCILSGNVAGESGGGVYNSPFSVPNVVNSLLHDNVALYGGGIYSSTGTRVVNCTLTANQALERGGGVYGQEGGTVVNSIIYFNLPDNEDHESNEVSYAYCCLTPELDGIGHVTAAPLFVDSNAGDYRLQPMSPCINAGNSTDVYGPFDLDGSPRVVDGIVDMGAYEYIGPRVTITTLTQHVSHDITSFALSGTASETVVGWMGVSNEANGVVEMFTASTNWTSPAVELDVGENIFHVYGINALGRISQDSVIITRQMTKGVIHYVSPVGGDVYPYTMWQTAARDLQDAIDAAQSNDTVVVTNGIYDTGGRIVGGYSLSNRVVVTNAILVRSVNGPDHTVICGASDPVTGGHGTNAVRGVYLTAGATLSGFAISNGYTKTSGNYIYEQGGGGLFLNGGGTVSNCFVRENAAYGDGGGVYCHGGGILHHCIISGNSATNHDYGDGGGIYCYSGGEIDHCTITNNWAKNKGGGIHCYYGGTVNQSLIFQNHVFGGMAQSGGGAYLWFGGVLNNCLISENHTGNEGGGVYFERGGQVNNCTIAANVTRWNGGGIRYLYGGTVRNTIIYFNEAVNGPNHYNVGELYYCCTTPNLGGTGTITNNPLFVHKEAGDYHLSDQSACINAGNNAYVAGEFDLDGCPRIQNQIIDMGAFEFVDGPPWWIDYNVLSPGAMINDYAAINSGQLKHVASKARSAMDDLLPGGAGTNVHTLVDGFQNSDNYTIVNLGQLKYVAQPFYDRLTPDHTKLWPLGMTVGPYPWSSSTNSPEHYSAGNIGQLKTIFSFDFSQGD